MDPKKSNEKGMERSASSGHGVPVDCQSNFSSSYACPRPQPFMDSFASSDMAALSEGSSVLAPALAPGLLPQAGLARFPAGFGFFDRSAWSSCIGGGGAMNVNAFNAAEHMNSSGGNAEPELGRSGHEEWPSSERSDSKRRRPNGEATGTEQVQSSSLPADSADESAHSKGRGEESSPATTAGMPKGKGAKGGSERRKEEYIHVRTRRGQATNSHSLAERLRREKISERMKLLQDLVPGCSKVTGKAVMLDEIINYVQSLQRQVEFLSMKLATVNPRLDVSIEGLLSKDLLRFPGVPSSSSIRFSQELMHPQLQLSQPALLQGSVPAMASPDVIRRVMQAQQPGSQMAHTLDGSFHGVAQIRDGFLM